MLHRVKEGKVNGGEVSRGKGHERIQEAEGNSGEMGCHDTLGSGQLH